MSEEWSLVDKHSWAVTASKYRALKVKMYGLYVTKIQVDFVFKNVFFNH